MLFIAVLDNIQHHQKGPSEQDLPSTNAVRDEGEKGAKEHIAEQREGHKQAYS